MAKFIDKVMNLVGLEEDYEESPGVEQAENEEFAQNQGINYRSSKKHQSKVVNIHTQGQFKVVIHQPESFEQSRSICDHLKNKQPIIVNVEDLEKGLAQRIIDFLSGSVYALNGHIQKVSTGIFLIAPQNVDILGEHKDTEKSAAFPWIR